MAEKKMYIAYGSNINLEQMAQRCPNAEVIGTVMLENYELEFRRVATVVPKEGARVPILLWQIDEQDEQSLDRYEGFPNLYRKEEFKVEVDDKVIKGMAYVMNGGQISPPQSFYYFGILEGYKANGMDTKYAGNALCRAFVANISQGIGEKESDCGIEETYGVMNMG